MEPDKPTLLGLVTRGKYQQSSEIPEVKPYLTPALEFATGAAHRPEGQSGSLAELAMATPVIGQVGRVARGMRTGVSKVLPHVLKVAEKGQPARSIVAVETIGKDGKKFIQPYYKSSGSSRSVGGGGNIRKDKYLPFEGRTPEWYVKGHTKVGGGQEMHFTVDRFGRKHAKIPEFAKNMSKEAQDYWARLQNKRLEGVSKHISKMEGAGKLKDAGTARDWKEINKWLEGYGFRR
tara:strand:- start:62 stop:763 length:702 start_codon:yes stop_codon:yes gene_type:complete